MAVFERQISAQVSTQAKNSIRTVLVADRNVILSTSEADVIRLALELGVKALSDIDPKVRCQTYALMRRGMDGPAETAEAGGTEPSE